MIDDVYFLTVEEVVAVHADQIEYPPSRSRATRPIAAAYIFHLAGNCQFGHCSPFSDSSSSSCAFDAQCPGGSCQMVSCSPFPR